MANRNTVISSPWLQMKTFTTGLVIHIIADMLNVIADYEIIRFKFRMKHQYGTSNINVYASNVATARKILMKIVSSPNRSIKLKRV